MAQEKRYRGPTSSIPDLISKGTSEFCMVEDCSQFNSIVYCPTRGNKFCSKAKNKNKQNNNKKPQDSNLPLRRQATVVIKETRVF